jgi:O-antigen/teichoic acid export membrane protein
MSSVIPISTNSHFRIALIFSGVTLLSLAFAWVLTPSFGVVGAATALMTANILMISIVMPTSLRQVQDSFRNFVTGLFAIPACRQVCESAPEA